MSRPTRAEIDLGAIAHNVAYLASIAAPARLCAVVKADGYGHGAIAVARRALESGATWLAVALVEEAEALRDAGIDAPVLVLSEPAADTMARALAARTTPMLCTESGVAVAARAAEAAGRRWAVHLKVDTGMRRVGCADDRAADIAAAIDTSPHLHLEGLATHLAAADENDRTFTDIQLDRFDKVIAAVAERGVNPEIVHAANSAGALLHPRSRYDMVRAGISVYGYPPSREHRKIAAQLRPALRLVSRVSQVKSIDAGEGVSYGLRWRADRPTTVATVPIGYADGVRRSLGLLGGKVLIRGERRPILGVVTMDQLMVGCSGDVEPGDEVVLIGEQGGGVITADDHGEWLDTISYEVLCDIGARVPRVIRP